MDVEQVVTFLQNLEPAHETHQFLWVGIHPDGQRLQAYGKLEEMLPQLIQRNKQGYGIFVSVNAIDTPVFDQKGYPKRRNEDITRVRAVFADWDKPNDPLPDIPLEPTMVVQTSPGKFHWYWCLSGESSDFPLSLFETVQRGISQRLGSDPSVIDLARIMRVPGFMNTKNLAKPALVVLEESNGPYWTAEYLREIFPYDAARSPKFSTWSGSIERKPAMTAAIVGAMYLPRLDGGYNVRCPWEHEHTTPSTPTSTTYWPPAERNSGRGSFVCMHAHCQGRMVDEYDTWISTNVAGFMA